jgi:hypothetical protein
MKINESKIWALRTTVGRTKGVELEMRILREWLKFMPMTVAARSKA